MATLAHDVVLTKGLTDLIISPSGDENRAGLPHAGGRPNYFWPQEVSAARRMVYEPEIHVGSWLASVQRKTELHEETGPYGKLSERSQKPRHEIAKADYYAAVKAFMVSSLISLPSIDRYAVANAARIDELRLDAADEGEPFSSDSAEYLKQFCMMVGAAQQPAIFLLANGNLRALWDDEHDQIGLQFLSDGMIQYVILQRQAGSPKALGTHEPDTVRRIAEAAGVSHLWSRGEG